MVHRRAASVAASAVYNPRTELAATAASGQTSGISVKLLATTPVRPLASRTPRPPPPQTDSPSATRIELQPEEARQATVIVTAAHMQRLHTVLNRLELRCILLGWREATSRSKAASVQEQLTASFREMLIEVQSKAEAAVACARAEVEQERLRLEAAKAIAKATNEELKLAETDAASSRLRIHSLEASMQSASTAAAAQNNTVTKLTGQVSQLEAAVVRAKAASAGRPWQPKRNDCHDVGTEAELPTAREELLRERLGEAVELLARSGQDVKELRDRMRLHMTGDGKPGTVTSQTILQLQNQLQQARRNEASAVASRMRAVADKEAHAARVEVLQRRVREAESDVDRLRELAGRWREVVMHSSQASIATDDAASARQMASGRNRRPPSPDLARIPSQPVVDLPRPASVDDALSVRTTAPPVPGRHPPCLEEAVLTPVHRDDEEQV